MALFEVDVAANRVRAEVDDGCFTIFGSALDDGLAGKLRVSVVASGIGVADSAREAPPEFVVEPSGEPPLEATRPLEPVEPVEPVEPILEEDPLPLLETAESEAEPAEDGDEPRSDEPGILNVPTSVTLADLGEPRSEALENFTLEPALDDQAAEINAGDDEQPLPVPAYDQVAKDSDPFLAAVLEGVKVANPETKGEEEGKGLLGRVSRLFKG